MKRIFFCLLLFAVSGALLAAAPGAAHTVASLTAPQTGPQITPQTAPQAKPATPPPAKPAAAKPAAKPAIKKARTEAIVPGPKDIRERYAIPVFLVLLWLAIITLLYILRWKIQESDRVYYAKFYAHKDFTGETGPRPSAGSGIPAGPSAL
jgi:hypothetical protein